MARKMTGGAMRPKGRTLSEFLDGKGSLAAAEQALLAACAEGSPARINEKTPEKRTSTNSIRAEFVRFLALGGDESAPVHEAGVNIHGAWIDGTIDLTNCQLSVPLAALDCRIDGEIRLIDAKIKSLHLHGSTVQGLDADRLRCEGNLGIGRSFSSSKQVRLIAAHIGANLECGGRLDGNGDIALLCNRTNVYGNVFLADKLEVRGEICFAGAQIGGEIHVRDTLIDGGVDLRNCELNGRLTIGNCKIEGAIDLIDAKIRSLHIIETTVHGVRADRLHCGARLQGEANDALLCSNTNIEGNLFLRNGFAAKGRVVLEGTRVRGDVYAGGATIESRDGLALWGDGVDVGGSFRLDDKFLAKGEVRLLRARIGRELNCDGGRFQNDNENALALDQISIGHNLRLTDVKVKGAIRLLNARVGGDLYLSGARFEGQGTLGCDGAEIRGGFFFRDVPKPPKVMSLSAAHVGTLLDDSPSWRTVEQILFNGFRYDRLGYQAPTDAIFRIEWLGKQTADDLGHDFKPQPWEQLVKVLREMGHDEEARSVAIEKQVRLRKAGKIAGSLVPLHWLFGILVGYGYRPSRAIWAVVLVWLSCGIFYENMATEGVFAPTDSRIYLDSRFDQCTPARGGNWTRCPFAPVEYTTFNSLAYSLDLILPLAGLSQDKDWAPMVSVPLDNTQRVARGGPKWWELGLLTRFVMWAEILFGWFISLMVAAVLGGLVKRD